MTNPGFEWPAPGAPTCGAVAQDRATGERFSCKLRQGHQELEHFWQEARGDQLRSVSWIETSFLTLVGPVA